MEKDLQEWANENLPAENLIWKDGYWDQIIFVRDKIPQLVFSNYDEAQEHRTTVISTHTSKSIQLPVYRLKLTNGITFTMRHNFHDWKISVNSPNNIEIDFLGLFDPEDTRNILGVFCEGFPDKTVFGCYADNKCKFTIELFSQYEVFTFFWILGAKLKLRKQ